ncbi:ERCC4 domain-containing protein [Mycena sanguinolenta]|uniref:Crossover junction endonuclease MUS81 n=1 Tax=Mycena sanguinolenta TaxID=230812 RepID=A0A8H7CFS1_9AGAR|nr:ERCC4 domain-containing protein [Mycena sanguinolenta]
MNLKFHVSTFSLFRWFAFELVFWPTASQRKRGRATKMPRATRPRLNAQYLDWLKELKDEEQAKESKRYFVYKRAFDSLKAQTKEFSTPRELLEVKFIGPDIVAKLEMRYAAQENGPSQSAPAAPAAPKKPRGRPPKRSATDVDMDPPPVAKRRTAGVELPAQASVTQPAPPGLQRSATSPAIGNRSFQFWYLDDHKPVLNRGCPGVVVRGRQPAPADENRRTPSPQSTAFPCTKTAVHPPSKARNLAALLAEEKLAQKRSNHSLDPSRQLPEYMQKQKESGKRNINAIASGSNSNGVNVNSGGSHDNATLDMRRAAAMRSHPSLSQGEQSLVSSRISTVRGDSPNSYATASAPTPVFHTRPRLSHAVPHLPATEHPSLYAPQRTFPDFAPRVFKAGTYSVHLVLDHREKRKNDRDFIAEGLSRKGVSVVRDSLDIGDVAWVARSMYDGDVCVLDVVLERKRLDDLAGSIKDPRFHEQKFRLHQSGMSRVFYLVEAYDTQRQMEEWGPQIKTALSSTAVVDGFLCNETKNVEDTIAFLATVTEELRRAHADKDLFVIPTHMIRRHSYLDLQKYLRAKHPGRSYVTSFKDFQALNSKSAHTTVRDTWARMLLCVKGMSAEKVGAVVDRWDTPRALWQAFRAAQEAEQEALAVEAAAADVLAAGPSKGKGRKKKSTVPEARLMLQGVGGAEGGARAIGQALSTKLYELFMSEDYQEVE